MNTPSLGLPCAHRKVTLTRERMGWRTYTCDTCGDTRTHFRSSTTGWSGQQLRTGFALTLFAVVVLLMWAGWVRMNDNLHLSAAECADTHAEPGTPEWKAAFALCLESPVTP